MVPNTPLQHRSSGSVKRKAAFETPPVPKFQKADGMSSPTDARAGGLPNGIRSVRSDRMCCRNVD